MSEQDFTFVIRTTDDQAMRICEFIADMFPDVNFLVAVQPYGPCGLCGQGQLHNWDEDGNQWSWCAHCDQVPCGMGASCEACRAAARH